MGHKTKNENKDLVTYCARRQKATTGRGEEKLRAGRATTNENEESECYWFGRQKDVNEWVGPLIYREK